MRVSDSYMMHLSRRDCPSARARSRNISNHSRTAASRPVSTVPQMDEPLSNDELDKLEALSVAATPGPWVANIEERGGLAGESMIQLGLPGDSPSDMYVYHDRETAPSADLDFIAAARNSMPRLIAEIRLSRSSS